MKKISLILIVLFIITSFSFAESSLESDLGTDLSPSVSDQIDQEENFQTNDLYNNENIKNEIEQPVVNDEEQRQDLFNDAMGN